MSLKNQLSYEVAEIIFQNFSIQTDVEIQIAREEFKCDYTILLFPLGKKIGKSFDEISRVIGDELRLRGWISHSELIKGFFNITLSDEVWLKYLLELKYSISEKSHRTILIEFASPNTNKPLHLGHLRNIMLGESLARILTAIGNKVIRAQIVNDRGIHICKSMIAWKEFSNGETPETTGEKGDFFVGRYYVKFDVEYKKQVDELVKEGTSLEEAKQQAPILRKAQELLQKWESGDEETLDLWRKMNTWVLDGFAVTFERLGITFDIEQYESQTYKLGKDIVQKGLNMGIFYQKHDGSVWIDLASEGLDEKLLLRADGTSVYITQDLGTAVQRAENFALDAMVYTVGNEQDYHFKVLFKILQKLGYEWAHHLIHLSYGMVELPQGKMKSREGTSVDADQLMDEMKITAKEIAQSLGKLEDFDENQKDELYEKIGQAALKYFLLKVDPKKNMLFDPKESIDFQGNTGPFLLYTYTRIQSVLRKAGEPTPHSIQNYSAQEIEKRLIAHLDIFQETVEKSAQSFNPAIVANYLYDLAKLFNSFYQQYKILSAITEEEKVFRLALTQKSGQILAKGLELLGISTIERM